MQSENINRKSLESTGRGEKQKSKTATPNGPSTLEGC
jgi:hypothetical protein